MADTAVREALKDRLTERLSRLGLTPDDLTDDLDLVRSGILDSLSFVDLITDLEGATGKQVDLERALGHRKATTVAGVISMFVDA
ncbi:MAG TPA: phosphopantetheine-binding protein [Flavobacteriales bacterium]|nr:hypothetical protein [Flavobacteriales bacterium]HMW96272.1 phosphopantetheine-binding protein [Flavobacteriales bacterium]HMZ48711.1 phosphopantetheine-binding protein [Flavobacteriales bacterium]HNE80314.1 phosphopantetheine-binding protein [Flavobacteriales bacterium]HNI05077.1 phosphopantetheine-binding protein [Flavobacteriales bacterium]